MVPNGGIEKWSGFHDEILKELFWKKTFFTL